MSQFIALENNFNNKRSRSFDARKRDLRGLARAEALKIMLINFSYIFICIAENYIASAEHAKFDRKAWLFKAK